MVPIVGIPRIGQGVDVHPFTPPDSQRPLWVGGLHWSDQGGLAGDSDADVVAHAACDALLGAARLGDLGAVFGTGDPRWAGASGVELLRHVVALVKQAGFTVGNVSVQLIANRPRFSARRAESEAVLSAAVGAEVSVAATTTDHLGLTGRGEGAAAVAVALIVPVAQSVPTDDNGTLTAPGNGNLAT